LNNLTRIFSLSEILREIVKLNQNKNSYDDTALMIQFTVTKNLIIEIFDMIIDTRKENRKEIQFSLLKYLLRTYFGE